VRQKQPEWIDENAWQQVEQGGATRAPPGPGVIVVDDGDLGK